MSFATMWQAAIQALNAMTPKVDSKWLGMALPVTLNPSGEPVEVSPAVASHNRFVTTAGTTLATDIATMLWTEAENVRNIQFLVWPDPAGTGVLGDTVKFVLDAAPVDDNSDIVEATAWLTTATVAVATDVEYDILIAGIDPGTAGPAAPYWSEPIYFNKPLRRADFIAYSTDQPYFIFARVNQC